jgi:hypothetical protein
MALGWTEEQIQVELKVKEALLRQKTLEFLIKQGAQRKSKAHE